MESNEDTTSAPAYRGMLWIAGGTFRMGSEDFHPEESPVRRVTVEGCWMDRCEVTNSQFKKFVGATGCVTLAERPLNPADFPGAPAENLKPGSMLFGRTARAVDFTNYTNWWVWAP
jgi:sulfatase modifying factor 1